jgi:hypothetical protein
MRDGRPVGPSHASFAPMLLAILLLAVGFLALSSTQLPRTRIAPMQAAASGFLGIQAGTPPATTIALGGNLGTNSWYVSNVSVTLTPSAAATTHYRVDRGSWSVYAAPFVLADGRHVVDYWSNNSGGSEAVKTVNVNVDATPPSFGAGTPEGVVTNPHVVVTWNVTDALSGIVQVETSLDNAPFLVPSGNQLKLDLPDGNHYVTVKATDAAGNFAIYVVSFQVDTSLLSPTGPFGISPLVGLLELIMVIGIGAVLLRRRARRAGMERPTDSRA